MTRHRWSDGSPHLFSIPSGVPFLPTFVAAFLGGELVEGFGAGAGPLALADATIFVPTRRSARALAATISSRLGPSATFLPRILPLADPDRIESASLLDPTSSTGVPGAAVSPVARRLVLTRLIAAWARSVGGDPLRRLGAETQPGFRVAGTLADAWHLSGELAGLLDEFTWAGLEPGALAPLGTEAFDRYWRLTLDFLTIATEHWPAILAERGALDPAARHRDLLHHEIARLEHNAAKAPVVVAGAFGSDPLTLDLLAAIARLPTGAVVLPGLDRTLDDASWTLLADPEHGAGHPQASFRTILATTGLDRVDVVSLGTVPIDRAQRAGLVTEAFRPAETTEAWARLATPGAPIDRGAALGGVTLIEAAHEGEEALALAIALRETLEGDGSAVLVTSDRTLARRVREELLRWDIEVDDSGGEPLAATPAGALARMALDGLVDGFDPVTMLSLLAHPACRLGRPRDAIERLRRWTERRLLRGVVPSGALADPPAFVAKARSAAHGGQPPAATPDEERRWADAETLLSDLVHALAPLRALGRAPFSDWLLAHEAAIATLTATGEAGSALAGADGTRLATLFADYRAETEHGLDVDLAGYAALFGAIAAETVVRGPERSHPRLKILGLIEFRLLDADRVCLGGLDEGVWPPPVVTDPFLNRPMRQALGLVPPEARIGQSAHDFTQALGGAEVIISRAAKRGGAPAVPSRFLQRLAAVAGEDAWNTCRTRGRTYLDYARALDRPDRPVTIARPNPKPPVALRPKGLSVTRVETLRRDPYAIYAEKILKLRPLDPIGASHGPREWGTAFHGVLKQFVETVRHGPVTADMLAGLLEQAQGAFEPLIAEPHTRAFMAPRLDRWVRAFHAWDRGRRDDLAGMHPEALGRLEIRLADGSTFELTATADRIEHARSGAVRLVDYKTGAVPSLKEVAAGFAPQLTLEAAIALGGGFAALAAMTPVEEALYVQFGTGRDVVSRALAWPDRTLADVAAEHLDGLKDLLDGFRDPDQGYVARPYPQFLARFGDYDHLSRVKEWSATGGLGDPAGDAA